MTNWKSRFLFRLSILLTCCVAHDRRQPVSWNCSWHIFSSAVFQFGAMQLNVDVQVSQRARIQIHIPNFPRFQGGLNPSRSHSLRRRTGQYGEIFWSVFHFDLGWTRIWRTSALLPAEYQSFGELKTQPTRSVWLMCKTKQPSSEFNHEQNIATCIMCINMGLFWTAWRPFMN